MQSLYTLQSPTLRPSPLRNPTRYNATTRRRRRTTFKLRVTCNSGAPKWETDPKKRVVITGMGLVSIFGNDVDRFDEKLLAGESGISCIDRFDASKFPTRFAGQIRGFSSEGFIDGKNDRRLDDCLRYCLVAGKKALAHAGLGGDDLSKTCSDIYKNG